MVIPNGVLASSIVTNYNLPRKKLWITVPVGVSYDSDLVHVETVAIEVAHQALASVQGSPSAEPAQVRYREFGESSIDFDVLLSVAAFTDQFLVRHEFIKSLLARFGEEGIEIPFPIRTVVFQGDAAAAGVSPAVPPPPR